MGENLSKPSLTHNGEWGRQYTRFQSLAMVLETRQSWHEDVAVEQRGFMVPFITATMSA